MNIPFDISIGFNERLDMPLISREAVRAIIFKEGKLLMLSTNRGDYKLPGGGIEGSESEREALYREVEEETGFRCKEIIGPIGKTFERRIDSFDKRYLFEMKSIYYYCEVEKELGKQNLTDEEIELGFKPIWIDIERAIGENKKILSLENIDHLWTNREITVLEIINENIKNLKEKVKQISN